MGVQPKCIWTEIAEYRDDTAITFDKFNNLLLDYGYSLKYSNGQDALYVHNSVVFTEYNPTLNTDYEKEVQRHIWLARYKVVQAFEWPDLLHPGDFFNLPKSIQDECKKYNLTPSDEIL
jgi:hypothetical protein